MDIDRHAHAFPKMNEKEYFDNKYSFLTEFDSNN